LLAYRFVIATAGMIVLCLVSGATPLRIRVWRILLLAGLGAGCYGVQSLLFFTALEYLPASLVELILYMYPALVILTGWLLLKRAVGRRLVLALTGSLLGVALLTGGAQLAFGLAILLAFATPIAYTAYLFTAEWAMRGYHALASSTYVIAGAALFWLIVAGWRNELTPPPGTSAWLIVFAFAIGPSIIAIPLTLSALARIGSERVSLISTFEPVVTVALAATVLGERLNPPQALGGLFILGSIVLLQWPSRTETAKGIGGNPDLVHPLRRR
jgi:drug/metabolite transporter (DMT)-like permease